MIAFTKSIPALAWTLLLVGFVAAATLDATRQEDEKHHDDVRPHVRSVQQQLTQSSFPASVHSAATEAIMNVTLCLPIQDAKSRHSSTVRAFFAVVDYYASKYPLVNFTASIIGEPHRGDTDAIWDPVWDTARSVLATFEQCDAYIGPMGDYWTERLAGVLPRPFVSGPDVTGSTFLNRANPPLLARAITAIDEEKEHRVAKFFTAMGWTTVNVLCDAQTRSRITTQAFSAAATDLDLKIGVQKCMTNSEFKNGTAALALIRQMFLQTRSRVVYITASRGSATALLNALSAIVVGASGDDVDKAIVSSTLFVMQEHFCARVDESFVTFGETMRSVPGALCVRPREERSKITAFEAAFKAKYADPAAPTRAALTTLLAQFTPKDTLAHMVDHVFNLDHVSLRTMYLVDSARALMGAFAHHANLQLREHSSGNLTRANEENINITAPTMSQVLDCLEQQPVFDGLSGPVSFSRKTNLVGPYATRVFSLMSLEVIAVSRRVKTTNVGGTKTESEMNVAAVANASHVTIDTAVWQFPGEPPLSFPAIPLESSIGPAQANKAPMKREVTTQAQKVADADLVSAHTTADDTIVTANVNNNNGAAAQTTTTAASSSATVLVLPLERGSASAVFQGRFEPIAPRKNSGVDDSSGLPTIVWVAFGIGLIVAVSAAVVTAALLVVLRLPIWHQRHAPTDGSKPIAVAFLSIRNETELRESGEAGEALLMKIHDVVEAEANRHSCFVARSLEAHHLIVSSSVYNIVELCAAVRSHSIFSDDDSSPPQNAMVSEHLSGSQNLDHSQNLDCSQRSHLSSSGFIAPPPPPTPALCCGIHAGPVAITKRGRALLYSGPTVQTTARLTDLVDPHQILATSAAVLPLSIAQTPDMLGPTVNCTALRTVFTIQHGRALSTAIGIGNSVYRVDRQDEPISGQTKRRQERSTSPAKKASSGSGSHQNEQRTTSNTTRPQHARSRNSNSRDQQSIQNVGLQTGADSLPSDNATRGSSGLSAVPGQHPLSTHHDDDTPTQLQKPNAGLARVLSREVGGSGFGQQHYSKKKAPLSKSRNSGQRDAVRAPPGVFNPLAGASASASLSKSAASSAQANTRSAFGSQSQPTSRGQTHQHLQQELDRLVLDTTVERQRAWARRGDGRGVLLTALSVAEGGLAVRQSAFGFLTLSSLIPRRPFLQKSRAATDKGKQTTSTSASSVPTARSPYSPTAPQQMPGSSTTSIDASPLNDFAIACQALVAAAVSAAKLHGVQMSAVGDGIVFLSNASKAATNPTRRVANAILEAMASFTKDQTQTQRKSARLQSHGPLPGSHGLHSPLGGGIPAADYPNAQVNPEAKASGPSSDHRPLSSPSQPEPEDSALAVARHVPCGGLMDVTVAGGQAQSENIALAIDGAGRGPALLASAAAHMLSEQRHQCRLRSPKSLGHTKSSKSQEAHPSMTSRRSFFDEAETANQRSDTKRNGAMPTTTLTRRELDPTHAPPTPDAHREQLSSVAPNVGEVEDTRQGTNTKQTVATAHSGLLNQEGLLLTTNGTSVDWTSFRSTCVDVVVLPASMSRLRHHSASMNNSGSSTFSSSSPRNTNANHLTAPSVATLVQLTTLRTQASDRDENEWLYELNAMEVGRSSCVVEVPNHFPKTQATRNIPPSSSVQISDVPSSATHAAPRACLHRDGTARESSVANHDHDVQINNFLLASTAAANVGIRALFGEPGDNVGGAQDGESVSYQGGEGGSKTSFLDSLGAPTAEATVGPIANNIPAPLPMHADPPLRVSAPTTNENLAAPPAAVSVVDGGTERAPRDVIGKENGDGTEVKTNEMPTQSASTLPGGDTPAATLAVPCLTEFKPLTVMARSLCSDLELHGRELHSTKHKHPDEANVSSQPNSDDRSSSDSPVNGRSLAASTVLAVRQCLEASTAEPEPDVLAEYALARGKELWSEF